MAVFTDDDNPLTEKEWEDLNAVVTNWEGPAGWLSAAFWQFPAPITWLAR